LNKWLNYNSFRDMRLLNVLLNGLLCTTDVHAFQVVAICCVVVLCCCAVLCCAVLCCVVMLCCDVLCAVLCYLICAVLSWHSPACLVWSAVWGICAGVGAGGC